MSRSMRKPSLPKVGNIHPRGRKGHGHRRGRVCKDRRKKGAGENFFLTSMDRDGTNKDLTFR